LSRDELLNLVDPRFRKFALAAIQRKRPPSPKQRRPDDVHPIDFKMLRKIASDKSLGETVVGRFKRFQEITRKSEDWEFLRSHGWPLVNKTPAQLKTASKGLAAYGIGL
jgi:hypothetical protein